jgi:flagellar protein FliO/FliZ
MRLTIATTLLLAFLSVTAGAETITPTQAAGDEATKTAEALTATVAEPVVKIEDKKESEIPLNLDAPKKASDESHPLFNWLFVISLWGLGGPGPYIFLRN